MERSYFSWQNIDLSVFWFFNKGLISPVSDAVARGLSSETLLVALLLVTLIGAGIKKRWDIVKWFCLALIVFGIVDSLCTFGIKPWVDRLRPCMAMPETVRAISGCRSRQGFPSNHAANSMALAFLVLLFGSRKLGAWCCLLAVCVAASRLYLGVHYPTDVLGGGLIGALVSTLFYLAMRQRTNFGFVRSRPLDQK